MMASVVLIVVLGAGAIYGSKRLAGKFANLPGKRIKIVETAHLGPRKAVHLLRIGDRCLLIGSTNDNISKLADLTTEILMQEKALDFKSQIN
jgi:flagellar biosynthetic protein FliO